MLSEESKGIKTEDPFRNLENYQALLHSVTDYVIAVNRNYQIIMANDLFKNKFGMQPGGYCYRLWKNRDEKCENCLVEKSFLDGKLHWSDETVVMKDGKSALVRARSTPVANRKGDIIYVLETATDITEEINLKWELHRMEGSLREILTDRLKELHKSEERYRTIFERSRETILLTDPDGKILEVNRAGVEMFGFGKKREVLSLNSAKSLFQNLDHLRQLQNRLFEDGFVDEFETRLLGKGGRAFDALIASNVIVDRLGDITGYVLMVRDITKRRGAQKQIEARNIRLSALNSISTTVSSSLDLDEVLNRTIDKILEILASECVRIYLLDSSQQILQLTASKGLSNQFTHMEHVRSRRVGDGFLGETVQTATVRVVDNLQPEADGYAGFLLKEGFKSTIYVPLVSKGEPVGVMCISSRSAFGFSAGHVEFLTAIGNQIGIAIHNANLYERTKKAYQELKEAQEQVIRSEKLASLGKLAATIAHEINNPLAVVLTYVRLMMKLASRDQFRPDRMEDVSRYLSIMESETAKCGEIVKNLLTFSRQSEITIRPHNIEEIIDKTLALIDHELEIKGIELVKKVETDLPQVKGDFRQIQQALLNLLSNAAEAMATGGTITVSASRSGGEDFLKVEISDTGCGIPEDDMEKIFEPFFTTKEEGKGVGLGLSVAYGIIARHGGSIEVKSEPNKGSTFTVRLPTK
ncbi:MAG: ATP-binding protein [Pseudomonadota bacterium]